MTAEKWASAVTEVVGGKAGGKEPIDEAVAVAERWIADKLKL